MDDARDLIALVSTDSEFDHFEAVRESHTGSLGIFVSEAVKSNLAAWPRLAPRRAWLRRLRWQSSAPLLKTQMTLHP